MNIVLVDSGIGGLTLLKRLIKAYPHVTYRYYADNAYHPYGDMDARELKEHLELLCNTFFTQGASAVILACNTASTTALTHLRKHISAPIFGVKPFLSPPYSRTLITCTPLTADSSTVKKYVKNGASVYANARLAKMIEEVAPDFDKLEPYLIKELSPFKVDRVSLGCTHYVYLKDVIERITGAQTTDGYDKLLKEITPFINKNPAKNRLQEGDYPSFIFSGKREEQKYAELFVQI